MPNPDHSDKTQSHYALLIITFGVEPESTAVMHAHADVGLSHKPSNLSSGHGLGSHSNPRDVRALL